MLSSCADQDDGFAGTVTRKYVPGADADRSPERKEKSGGVLTLTHTCDTAEVQGQDADKIASYIRGEVDAGRRKFSDLEAVFPYECRIVLEVIGQVFDHDEQARLRHLPDRTRWNPSPWRCRASRSRGTA